LATLEYTLYIDSSNDIIWVFLNLFQNIN